MFRYLLFPVLFLIASFTQVYAQKGSGDKYTKSKYKSYKNDSTATELYHNTAPEVVKPSRDFLMLALTYNRWLVKPDSVKTKSFNYGFNGNICYDFPIKKSNFSFATGLGINVSATYLDQEQIKLNDTSAVLGAQARFVPDTAHFSRYKFVTAYLQAPFELRYFANMKNRNKGFKAALGLQIGTLLGAHTKGVTSISGTNVKEKMDTKRYVSPWNFAATMRIGWGNFSLFTSYNLTPVFKENSGPPITPASIGFCVTGL